MTLKMTLGAASLAVLALTGCSNDAGTKETVGTVGGAVIGGLLGAQFGSGTGQIAAAAAGTAIGMMVGNQIGAALDENDKHKAMAAQQQATTAPIGQTITWDNPESGNSGSVTPVRDGTSSDGNQCREFQETVVIGGKEESAYGTACRQPDGTWRIN
ncbi:RT0821/Lpp0805 family surface protein [Rhodovibrionaceae bacterium A322]